MKRMVDLIDVDFTIKEENFDDGLDLLVAHEAEQDYCERKIFSSPNMASALYRLGFDVKYDFYMNIKSIELLNGSIPSDSEQYFKALAPVVADGFVEMRDEEGNRWRWVFKSGVMSVVRLKEVGISTKHVGDNLMIVTENIDGEKYAIFSDRITTLLEDWNNECEFVPDNNAKVYFAIYNEKVINPYSYSDFESLIKLLKEEYGL